LNYLSPPLPPALTSAANLVLAKSKEYTTVKPTAPAVPPEARFPAKNLQYYFSLSTPLKNYLYKLSLTAKFIPVVGIYLNTLGKFPLQKA
jgi:hypothetical protein